MKVVASLIALQWLASMSVDVSALRIKQMKENKVESGTGVDGNCTGSGFGEPTFNLSDENPCENMTLHPAVAPLADNIECIIDGVMNTFPLGEGEQAAVNVTRGYQGELEVDRVPITEPYYQLGMCPVNVHWHLGTEHYSAGEYDENGTGPSGSSDGHRNLAEGARPGFQCHYYDEADPMFTVEYNWQHCVDMHVGETYEVHWPHSKLGACASVNQFQTPFYDGVFCELASRTGDLTNEDGRLNIGVQAQVFTIVNDDSYYYPELMRGMIVEPSMGLGSDIAYYTGSTTSDSRSNEICSQYTGITWQVDRKCHLISASSFDKMCFDMKNQKDDMSGDLYPHGSRELVADHLAANNQQRKLN